MNLRTWSRRLTPNVQNTTKYFYHPSKVKEYTGAYATTKVVIFPNDNNHQNQELELIEFIEAFKTESMQYYNLKTLCIHAPYSVIDGDIIATLLDTKSTLTSLQLNVFGFHTPKENMWIPTNNDMKLTHLDITLQDGYAFPKSGTELLRGLERSKNIQEVRLYNESPHFPVVKLSRKLRNKMYYTSGVKLQYT